MTPPQRTMVPHPMGMMMPSQQGNKKSRTVYVGNVQPGITEAEVRSFFNESVAAVQGRPETPTVPVDVVDMHTDKKFAFVEFHTPTGLLWSS